MISTIARRAIYLTIIGINDRRQGIQGEGESSHPRFWSSSSRKALSLPMQTRASASPASLSSSMPPVMQVRTHSYRSETAEVVVMRLVMGGRSLRMSRGS